MTVTSLCPRLVTSTHNPPGPRIPALSSHTNRDANVSLDHVTTAQVLEDGRRRRHDGGVGGDHERKDVHIAERYRYPLQANKRSPRRGRRIAA